MAINGRKRILAQYDLRANVEALARTFAECIKP
jgi:hypothetical protein